MCRTRHGQCPGGPSARLRSRETAYNLPAGVGRRHLDRGADRVSGRANLDAGAGEWVDATVIRAHHHGAGARHGLPVDVAEAVLASAVLPGAESNDSKPGRQAVADAQTPGRATGSGSVGSFPSRVQTRRCTPARTPGASQWRGWSPRVSLTPESRSARWWPTCGSSARLGSPQDPGGPGPGRQGPLLSGDPRRVPAASRPRSRARQARSPAKPSGLGSARTPSSVSGSVRWLRKT
jgi:hypothetical protein